MLFLTDITSATAQMTNIYTEIYKSPATMKIMFLSLSFAAVFAIAHKHITWFHEKKAPKLQIAASAFAGIGLLIAVGGLLASLNVTSTLAYGLSSGAITVLTLHCIGSILCGKGKAK